MPDQLTFKGLNLKSDPEDLDPGECVDCLNVYTDSGKMITRSFFRKLTNIVLPFGFDQVWSAYCSRRPSGAYDYVYFLVKSASTAKLDLYVVRYNRSTKSYWSYNILAVGLFPAVWGINWIEFENKIYVCTGSGQVAKIENDSTFSYVEGFPIDPSSWPNVQGTGTPPYYTWGINQDDGTLYNIEFGEFTWYIVAFKEDENGVRRYSPFLTYSDNISGYITSANRFSITFNLYLDTDSYPGVAGYDGFLLYRQDVDVGEDRGYLVRDFNEDDWDAVTGVYTLEDNIENASKNFNIFTTGEATVIPQNMVIAAKYRDRVVWGDTQGRLWFSNPRDAETIQIPINGPIPITKNSMNQINGLVELQGTLVIFTDEGIYHLVGTISNSLSSSNYEIYHVHPDLVCRKFLVIENRIFFLTDSELRLYNLQEHVQLSEIVESEFNLSAWQDSTYQTGLGYDPKLKHIYITYKETFFVYNYENKTWTKYSWPDNAFLNYQGGGMELVPEENTADVEIIYRPVFFGKYNQNFPIMLGSSDAGTSVEGQYDWLWQTGQLHGGVKQVKKKWQELRVWGTCDIEAVTDKSVKTLENSMGKYNRLRLKLRSHLLTLKFYNTVVGRQEITSFSLAYEPIGR